MVTSLVPILLLGFFLGMRHATDADHVLAVTTIVSRERSLRGASWIGVLWGIGHTLTIMVVGGAIIFFGVVIPPRLGLTMELSVAVMLVLLGVFSLRGFLRSTPRPAAEGTEREPHGHDRDLGVLDRVLGRLGFYQSLRPLLVGVVHGLAGSAAVALMVLATVQNPARALAYLLLFGVGTVAGMALITAGLALPFAFTQARSARLHRSIGILAGLSSVAFGIFLVYDIGIVAGLFTHHAPQWTPE